MVQSKVNYGYEQGYKSLYHPQQPIQYEGFPFMEGPMQSASSAFCPELLQYKIPHSKMIPNILKYNDTMDLDEHIDTYERTMASL